MVATRAREKMCAVNVPVEAVIASGPETLRSSQVGDAAESRTPSGRDTLVEQQQQLGAHVTTLTDAYDSLSENVNRMIDASNGVTRELNGTFSLIQPRGGAEAGRTGTGRTAWRVELRILSKAQGAAGDMTSTCSSHADRASPGAMLAHFETLSTTAPLSRGTNSCVTGPMSHQKRLIIAAR